jgi:hypothetical protein
LTGGTQVVSKSLSYFGRFSRQFSIETNNKLVFLVKNQKKEYLNSGVYLYPFF